MQPEPGLEPASKTRKGACPAATSSASASTEWRIVGSYGVLKHGLVVAIPIALEAFGGIVFPFQLQELRELRIACQHLLASRVPVVGEIVGAVASRGHIDQSAERIRRVCHPL